MYKRTKQEAWYFSFNRTVGYESGIDLGAGRRLSLLKGGGGNVPMSQIVR